MIIGISGKMRVGKSTVTGYLDGMLPVWHAPHNFGDEVKDECARLLDIPRSWFHDQDMKDQHAQIPASVLTHFGLEGEKIVSLTLREVMQRRGQAARLSNPRYWVYRLHERIQDLANVVIDDVRYPDEAEYIRGRKGILIRIHPHQFWKAGPHSRHESEIALDEWTDWDMELHPEFGALKPAAMKIAQYVKQREDRQ